jgi:hypothetical protein
MQITSPKIKPVFYIIILLMAVFCCRIATADASPQVKTDKDTYSAGETIRVNYSNAPGYKSDWICVVPAGSPDTEGGDFKYIPNRESDGVLTFDVPSPGKYEVRAYYNYSRNRYEVSARYSFTVGDKVSAALPLEVVEIVKQVESPPVTAFAGGTRQISVSFFQFTPLSMDVTNYGIIVTNTLINAPKMQASFTMLSRKDLEMFLVSNNLQQNDQTDNMIEIGTMLGLDYVIAGNIEKRGAMIVTNCKVVSITGRNVIFTNKFVSMGDNDLINNVRKMSDSIVESIRRGTN